MEMRKPSHLPSRPVVLVTGATDGIGRAAARMLVERGARVVVHGRSEERSERVARELRALKEDAVAATVLGDFSSLDAVRQMATEVEARVEALHVLVNNAGVFMNERKVSAEGFEMTFAVNHLAPFLLTHLLLRQKGSVLERIANVSSNAHRSGHISQDDLRVARQPFSPARAYATSKLANVLFTLELARRVKASNILVSSLHPGVISTKLLTEGFGMRGYDSLEDAARTIAKLSLEENVGSGLYFHAGRPAAPSAEARDAELARTFYEESARMVGIAPLETA